MLFIHTASPASVKSNDSNKPQDSELAAKQNVSGSESDIKEVPTPVTYLTRRESEMIEAKAKEEENKRGLV